MQSTHTRLDIAILFLLHVHALVRYKIYLHFHVFVAFKWSLLCLENHKLAAVQEQDFTFGQSYHPEAPTPRPQKAPQNSLHLVPASQI